MKFNRISPIFVFFFVWAVTSITVVAIGIIQNMTGG